jgi:hypothetical protein
MELEHLFLIYMMCFEVCIFLVLLSSMFALCVQIRISGKEVECCDEIFVKLLI